MVSGPGSPPSSLKFTMQPQVSTTPLLNQQQNSTTTPQNSTATGSLSQRLASLASFSERRTSERGERGGEEKSHRKNFSLSGKNWMDKSSSATKSVNSGQNQSSSLPPPPPPPLGCSDRLRLMGTVACPRLDEIPMLEPLVCKKVAHERLTALLFREDCIITACHDGIVCTWARPNTIPQQTSNDDHGGTMV